MRFQVPQKIKLTFGSLFLAAILLLAIVWGTSLGQQLAQAAITVQTAKNLAAAAQYFYQDQNRYPTALEFNDQNTMLNYLTGFPPPNFISGVCGQSFNYKPISDNGFQLNFCLPVAEDGYQKGWNAFSGSPGASFN